MTEPAVHAGNGSKPVISVIVITYLQEETIGQTLESILAQQIDVPFEIVISDDCSPDGSREIIDRYSNANPDVVRPVHPGRNLGISGNFLHCLDQCRGDYIALCEGDDFWIDEQKLARQYQALEREDCDLAFTRGYKLFPDGTREPFADYGDDARLVSLEDLLGHFRWIAPSASLFWRASATKRIGSVIKGAPIADAAIIILAGAKNGAWYDASISTCYRIGARNSFTSLQSEHSESRRRNLIHDICGVLSRSCLHVGLPVSIVRARINDKKLQIARSFLMEGKYLKAARTLATIDPSFWFDRVRAKIKRLAGRQ